MRNWQVSVTFVPFESETERDHAYRETVRLFLQAQKAKLARLKKEEKESHKEAFQL